MIEINNEINIGGLQFEWDLDKGQFLFEGEDAVLFWITSAMKTFFETIEEISGEEASNLVFEATGFRQGLVVGGYFEQIKHVTIAEAGELITNTYASAGWGHTILKDLDIESKTVTVQFKDSWEHKINKAQGKKKPGSYLPAHYAGIFTSLFGTNIWYEVIQFQLEGHEYTKVKYFPSDITVSNNIHELARKKESDKIIQLEAVVEDKTRELRGLIKQLSSPIIPVHDGVVVVPLLGKYDEERSQELVENTLSKLPSYKANYLVLDLTGLDKDISQLTASLIEKIGSAAALIGTETILVGISAELSIEISESDINLTKFDCFQTLQHGIHYALGQLGRRII